MTGANLLVNAFDNLIEKVGLLGTLAAAGGIVALTRSVGRAKWIALENVPTYVRRRRGTSVRRDRASHKGTLDKPAKLARMGGEFV